MGLLDIIGGFLQSLGNVNLESRGVRQQPTQSSTVKPQGYTSSRTGTQVAPAPYQQSNAYSGQISSPQSFMGGSPTVFSSALGQAAPPDYSGVNAAASFIQPTTSFSIGDDARTGFRGEATSFFPDQNEADENNPSNQQDQKAKKPKGAVSDNPTGGNPIEEAGFVMPTQPELAPAFSTMNGLIEQDKQEDSGKSQGISDMTSAENRLNLPSEEELSQGSPAGGAATEFSTSGDTNQNAPSDEQIFQDWKSEMATRGIAMPYETVNDFQRYGTSDQWLDYMLSSEDKYAGLYDKYLQDALGDAVGFDRNNEEAWADARNRFRDNWYDPWVNEHTLDDLVEANLQGAEIIGGLGGSTDLGTQIVLNAINSGESAAPWYTRADTEYQVEYDPEGRSTGISGGSFVNPESENYEDSVRTAMKLMQSQANALGNIYLDESALEGMQSGYDMGDLTPDFGMMGTRIKGNDNAYYSTAGLEGIDPAVQEAIINYSGLAGDLGIWENPVNAQIAMNILSNAQGRYGSNLSFTPEQIAAANQYFTDYAPLNVSAYTEQQQEEEEKEEAKK